MTLPCVDARVVRSGLEAPHRLMCGAYQQGIETRSLCVICVEPDWSGDAVGALLLRCMENILDIAYGSI